MVKEKVNYDTIIRFLTNERDLAQKAKPAANNKDQIVIPKED